MLKGKIVTLRPVEEADLPLLYRHITDLENRGEFFGRTIATMEELQRQFSADGFWGEASTLVMIDNESDRPVGRIWWGPTVRYMDELEVGYILYDRASRSKGAMTEALKMVTNYLFDTRPLRDQPVNRLRLCIRKGNVASLRVAEKAGYYHEATQRGAVGRGDRHYDMELYSVLRSDTRSYQEKTAC
jgi:RimJ/RimL family protein N-acetyltransferase